MLPSGPGVCRCTMSASRFPRACRIRPNGNTGHLVLPIEGDRHGPDPPDPDAVHDLLRRRGARDGVRGEDTDMMTEPGHRSCQSARHRGHPVLHRRVGVGEVGDLHRTVPYPAAGVRMLMGRGAMARHGPTDPVAGRAELERWTERVIRRAKIRGSRLGSCTRANAPSAVATGSGTGSASSRRPRTVYGIASMTKSFTALAILRLQEQGRLRVTDPVARHLPEFRTRNHVGPARSHCTISSPTPRGFHHCLRSTTRPVGASPATLPTTRRSRAASGSTPTTPRSTRTRGSSSTSPPRATGSWVRPGSVQLLERSVRSARRGHRTGERPDLRALRRGRDPPRPGCALRSSMPE